MTKLQTSLIVLVFISLGWWGNDQFNKYLDKDLSLPSWSKPRPLEKYNIESLSEVEVKPTEIKINENVFEFQFDPTLQDKNTKKVTGSINIPESTGLLPIVILFRGYVDQSIYQTGIGTKRVSEYFAENGYITLAPDFLGYGGSDPQSENIFEARFQTYTTALILLKSIQSPTHAKALIDAGWDGKSIFIWGHSNGGQIALTLLEVTGVNYPTVLWAPVTEGFPYSILFYTNESDDGGKFIRKELAKFEENYDVDKFSLTNYLDRINAPIEYHFGTSDDAIPAEWRDRFLNRMKTEGKDITNYNHSGADHNMNPLWSEVMQQTLQFFANHEN